MTRAARIAWGITAAALAGWAVSFVLPEVWWVVVFRHACEGAFVGGICDAFAIWKVYSKVETNFEQLTEAVSSTVIDDMIKPEEVIAQLQGRLHEPEFARQLMGRVETLIPDPQAIETFLTDAWMETLRERCVTWLIELDASNTLAQLDQHPGGLAIHRDPMLRAGVYRCLKHAAADTELSDRLYQGIIEQYGQVSAFEIPAFPPIKRTSTPVPLEKIIRRVLDPETLHQRLLEAVDQMMAPTEGGEELPLREVAMDYARRYSDGWVQTPLSNRRLLATRLVDQLVPPLIHSISEEIWSHRNDLNRIVSDDMPLNAHPAIEYISLEVSRLLTEKLSALDGHSADLLVERLRAQGSGAFREMLERRTRPELDWIQVNGAGLGLVLGTLAGVVSALLH
ncbi:MAG: hypothetical protein P8R54_30900 [Myxococcota bacterium]|nr:hypothetical protein [Myxococcota bacterium]